MSLRVSVNVCVRARVASTLPCAREESEQKTRLHRKQRITVIPPSVIPLLIPLILLFVVPLFILRVADEGCARRRSVPLLVTILASMHLPRAEREPSTLSPGRMLLHIQKTEGERVWGRESERGDECVFFASSF